MKSIEKRMITRYNAEQYNIFQEQATEVARQTVAMMLYALSMKGYGTKRLNMFFDWFVDVLQMPKVFGREVHTMDAMEMLTDRHGIDFGRIKLNLQSYAEYARDKRQH